MALQLSVVRYLNFVIPHVHDLQAWVQDGIHGCLRGMDSEFSEPIHLRMDD